MGAPYSIPDLRRPSCSVRPLARKAKDSDAFRGPSPSLKVSLQKIPHACRRPPLDTVAALHMRADGIAGEVVGLNRRPRTPNAQAERRRPEGRRPRARRRCLCGTRSARNRQDGRQAPDHATGPCRNGCARVSLRTQATLLQPTEGSAGLGPAVHLLDAQGRFDRLRSGNTLLQNVVSSLRHD